MNICRNSPCKREAQTTVRIFERPSEVCYSCGARIRARQEGLFNRQDTAMRSARAFAEALRG